MKLINRIFMILSLTGLILSGCSEDDAPSTKEKQLNKLSGTWVVTSATMGSVDYTNDYSAFELTLSGSANTSVFAYGVVGRPEISPWLAGGTWSFGNDIKTDIIRDPGTIDELDMNYSIADGQLTVTFNFTGDGYSAARVSSVSGDWIYILEKK